MSEQRYVFLSHTSRPGGGELALARFLAASSIRQQFTLATFHDGRVWEPVRRAGVPVIVIAGTRNSTAWNVLGLARLMRREQDALFIANSMRIALIAAIVRPRRGSLIYWVRDGLIETSTKRGRLLTTRFVTLRRVSGCLANSAWTAASVRRLRGELPLRIAPSPSGIARARMSLSPRLLPATHDVVRLLFLGRVAPWKAPHVAIDALAVLERSASTRFELTIAGAALFGEHGYEAGLRTLAATRDNVSLAGHVKDVEPLLRDHDILVHCSVTPEPYGQVIVQGLAHGLPVVATHGGGPSAIIRDGIDGLLYEPGDARALASCLRQLCSDPGRYRAMSAQAISRAEEFADEVVIHTTDVALQELAGLRPHSTQVAR